jgi:hypothetical protein
MLPMKNRLLNAVDIVIYEVVVDEQTVVPTMANELEYAESG